MGISSKWPLTSVALCVHVTLQLHWSGILVCVYVVILPSNNLLMSVLLYCIFCLFYLIQFHLSCLVLMVLCPGVSCGLLCYRQLLEFGSNSSVKPFHAMYSIHLIVIINTGSVRFNKRGPPLNHVANALLTNSS